MALVIVTVGACFFFWAMKSQQFDDLDRQGANILFDDDVPRAASKSKSLPSDDHSSTADKNSD
jgi:cbb3-type cytochrome oxidase maturation protein